MECHQTQRASFEHTHAIEHGVMFAERRNHKRLMRAAQAYDVGLIEESARLYEKVGRSNHKETARSGAGTAAGIYVILGDLPRAEANLARMDDLLRDLPEQGWEDWHAFAYAIRAQIFRYARRFDEALAEAHHAVRLDPAPDNRHIRAIMLKHSGQLSTAIAELGELVERNESTEFQQSLVGYLHLAGQHARANTLHEAIPQGQRSENTFNEAWIAACRDDQAECYRLMRFSYERAHATFLTAFYSMDVEFDRYRRDPEFQQILASHGDAKS